MPDILSNVVSSKEPENLIREEINTDRRQEVFILYVGWPKLVSPFLDYSLYIFLLLCPSI